ncbi:hypothetical protein CHUAL_007498 [Chamberlinius hualienensis]
MNKQVFRTINEHCYSVQFSPFFGNELVAVANQNFGLKGYGKLYYLELLPNGVINPLSVCHWPTDAFFDVCWSEVDAGVCITACGDGSLQLWNRSHPGQPLKVWKEHEKEVYSVQWSQNRLQSHYVASASWDSTVKIWDVNASSSVCTLQGHQNIAYSTSWAVHIPNTIASSSGDQSIRIWDLKSPGTALVISNSHQGEVLHCDWNKYNQNLLASAGTDGIVRGWDIRNTTHCVFQLLGHEYAVKRVKFSPHNESILATVSYDFSTRIWDFKRSPQIIDMLTHHTEFVYGLDFNLHIPGQLADCSFDQFVAVYTPQSLGSMSS